MIGKLMCKIGIHTKEKEQKHIYTPNIDADIITKFEAFYRCRYCGKSLFYLRLELINGKMIDTSPKKP
jgi:hypothetical protein